MSTSSHTVLAMFHTRNQRKGAAAGFTGRLAAVLGLGIGILLVLGFEIAYRVVRTLRRRNLR